MATEGSTPENHPSKFTGKQAKHPAVAALSKFTASFSTAHEQGQNIFYQVNAHTLAEFRAMMGRSEATGPMSRDERKLYASILREAAADAKKYHIPLPAAAALRFAADQAHLDHDAFLQQLATTQGKTGAVDPIAARQMGPFKFDAATWLYMVKAHGPEHGLDYFSNKITVASTNGRSTVEVQDPAVLREILSLRDNPLVSALLSAEYIKHQTELPPLSYKGSSLKPDDRVTAQQKALLTLGFDLGLKGADGINGPLTKAALAEFSQMTQLLPAGKSLDDALQDAARQAALDSRKYSNRQRIVTPADAFAICHASAAVGVDYGFMMELAKTESGFKPDAKASTSSATGLFQFTDNSWLIQLYLYGDKYGLGDIAKKIEITKDKHGHIATAIIRDPLVNKYALDLRGDPRIAALMAAEFAKDNTEQIQESIKPRAPTRTDQYLAHFLGAGQAICFLNDMKKDPNQAANACFQTQASKNPDVFYKPDGSARSLQEIYNLFDHKFYTRAFDNERKPSSAGPVKSRQHTTHTPSSAV